MMTAAQTAGLIQQGGIPFKAQLYLDEVYRYCVLSENGKVFIGWPAESMKLLIAHRFLKARLITHRNPDGEIDGVMMWHRFRQGWTFDKFDKWEDDDEDGEEIFILAAFSDTPEARRWGVLEMIRTEPDVIHLKLKALRHKAGKKEMVDYPQKLLARLLKK